MPNIYRSVMSSSSPPAVLQSKTVTAGTSDILVEPDVGYDGLSDVTVEPTPSQSKSATPTTSAQTITPDSGKLLSQVDIAPIPSQYKIPTQIMPSSTPASMTAGEAYSPTSNAYLIDGYSEVYPSDAYPAALYSGMIKSGGSGYAISSYSSSSKTPSPTGEYFYSGWNRMTSSGYAYSGKPQMTETTLWTNSNVANTFAGQVITLSDSITNYDYIKITVATSTTNTTEYTETMFKVSDFITYVHPSSSVNHWPQPTVGARAGGADNFRALLYAPDNQISISNAVTAGSTQTYTTRVIPVTVKGLKL